MYLFTAAFGRVNTMFSSILYVAGWAGVGSLEIMLEVISCLLRLHTLENLQMPIEGVLELFIVLAPFLIFIPMGALLLFLATLV